MYNNFPGPSCSRDLKCWQLINHYQVDIVAFWQNISTSFWFTWWKAPLKIFPKPSSGNNVTNECFFFATLLKTHCESSMHTLYNCISRRNLILLKVEVIVWDGFSCVKIVGIVCYLFFISWSSFNFRTVSQQDNVHVHYVLFIFSFTCQGLKLLSHIRYSFALQPKLVSCVYPALELTAGPW